MNNPLTSVRAYEEFVYTLQQTFPAIKVSTLVLKRQGRTTAILVGNLLFEKDIRLFGANALTLPSRKFWAMAMKFGKATKSSIGTTRTNTHRN